MFQIIFLIGFILGPVSVFAQVQAPRFINVQSVLVDEGGNVLYDKQEEDITFSIVDGAGEIHYEEIQHAIIVHGATSVLVGEGTDPDTGEVTGGIPYEAFLPNGGDFFLRMKLSDQSIPQEDLRIVSVPYSMYSQLTLGLVNPLESSGILDGTIQQVDLSPELLAFIDNSMSGVSAQDLLEHQTADGAHPASSISVENHFVNAAGRDLQTVLEGLDAAIGTRRNQDDIILVSEISRAGDTIYGNLDFYNTTDPATITADTAPTITMNPSLGSILMTGNLTLDIANIIMSDGNTVDGVDISLLDTRVVNIENKMPDLPEDVTLDEWFVNTAGDTMTGDLNMGENNITNINEVDGVDLTDLNSRVGSLENGTTLDSRYVNVNGGDTMNGSLTMNGGNIVMTGGETVDEVDVGSHNHSGINQGGTISYSSLSDLPTIPVLPDFSAWDQNASDDLTSATSFGGDVSSTYNSETNTVDIQIINLPSETPPEKLAFAYGHCEFDGGDGTLTGYNVDTSSNCSYLVGGNFGKVVFATAATSTNYYAVITYTDSPYTPGLGGHDCGPAYVNNSSAYPKEMDRFRVGNYCGGAIGSVQLSFDFIVFFNP